MILTFLWYVLRRFAKTVGCLFFIAGLLFGGGFYAQRAPSIEAARYRESTLLHTQTDRLQMEYRSTRDLVRQFKAAPAFPPAYAAANMEPHFPAAYLSDQDFRVVDGQLSEMTEGRDAMKRFVVDRFNTLLGDIQSKLLAHAAALTPAVPQSAPVIPSAPFNPDFGVFEHTLNDAGVHSRKSTLETAQAYLGVLQTAAKAEANQKILNDSIWEITALAKLLPQHLDPPPPLAEEPLPKPNEPLNAEKVAYRLAQIRANVAQAILSAWVIDSTLTEAMQMADSEHRQSLNANIAVQRIVAETWLMVAASIAVGTFLGMFFLLIGDWTKRSSADVLEYWCELLPNYQTSVDEVYGIIESTVAARNIPEVKTERVNWHEGGALSSKREYLRFSRERLATEICAAPYGTGFFLSYRSCYEPIVMDPLAFVFGLFVLGVVLAILGALFGLLWGGIILVLGSSTLLFLMRAAVARGLGNLDQLLTKIPLLGALYELFIRPVTYYRIDSTAMYIKTMRAAVAEALREIFGTDGIDLLPGTVDPPTMKDILGRRFW